MNGSKRKPHSDNAGYVCELKSRHPKLPGHFVVYDATKTDLDQSSGRWVCMHEPSGYHICFDSQQSARDMMKHMAGGGNDGDFGQHEEGR